MGNKKFKFTDLSDEIFVSDNLNEINTNVQKIEKNISNESNALFTNKINQTEAKKDIPLENNSFVVNNLNGVALEIQPTEKNVIENYKVSEPLKNQSNYIQPEAPYKNESNLSTSKEESFNTNINKLIQVKEKLEVKTNIYLKSDLVRRIKRMCDETGNSRSAIINKLLEYAIKDFE